MRETEVSSFGEVVTAIETEMILRAAVAQKYNRVCKVTARIFVY